MFLVNLSSYVFICCLFVNSVAFTKEIHFSEQRDNAILIHVINDTNDNVDKIIIKTKAAQFFVCTMLHSECTVAVFQAGTADLLVKSQMESGISLFGHIRDASPGSNHSVHVSDLIEQNPLDIHF